MEKKPSVQGFIAIFVILVAAIILVGIYILVVNSKATDTPMNLPVIGEIQEKVADALPTSSPFPFQEMTIPHLRGREYQSQLGELRKVSETQRYTAYLTSYPSDGLKINGYLTEPKGKMPTNGWPAIIFIHGYIPPKEYRTTQNYLPYVDYFAKNGFVVFKIDLRGHDQSEGEPGGAYYSEDYVIDTLNAYSALESSSLVRKGKIGLWGHSMAGNIVMRALAAKPEIPAVVVWAGAGYTYSDIQEYRIQDNSYRPPSQDSERIKERELLRELHGDFNPNSDFWKQVAVTQYLTDLKGAIEIHHAINDDVVSVEYSRNLMKLLDATDVPHTLYEYPSGGHNLTGATFNEAMQRSVDFFNTYLSN